MCKKRDLAKSLNGMPDAKKAAMKAEQAKANTPEARKALSAEARKMIDAYCKPSNAVGASTTICLRTVSVLEMGKRLFKRHQPSAQAAAGTDAIPHVG